MSGFFAWLKSRFPRRGEAFLAFMVCLLPVHIWSIIAFLRTVPSYMLWVDLGRLVSIFAYMQVFAFMESLIFFLLVMLLAFLLPRGRFLDRFVPQATLLALVAMLWVVPVHYLSVQAAQPYRLYSTSFLPRCSESRNAPPPVEGREKSWTGFPGIQAVLSRVLRFVLQRIH